jgi:two-component system chemotaxis response regulator CheB
VSIEPPIRVLIVDDSAANRRNLTSMLEAAPGIQVVDRAADGEEGLKKAILLRPDVITLDLEMPRLDGFGFLRLLMARAPTPVIVLSSYGHPSDVFKALKLGAYDFIAKPKKGDREALELVRHELIEKVRGARFVKRENPQPSPPLHERMERTGAKKAPPSAQAPLVLAIGASTGGPPAVQKLLEAVGHLPVAVLVAQHMPARFTTAFAERLDQALALEVREAKHGERLEAGHVYIAPGGEQLEVTERKDAWTLSVLRSSAVDRYSPSVDRLFESLAHVVGPQATAVVLTGMGNDGARGVVALAQAGAQVWAESESSAVVFGMPEAAIATGKVSRVLPLDELGPALARALEARLASRRV